ncbi:hypothetical protein [Calothrix sp. NIES-2098]|uniref:hypothetical protein n=1 Tax=Calothrix sp. NIES-2098 TaxID=1954171 RepID=UPI0030D7B166
MILIVRGFSPNFEVLLNFLGWYLAGIPTAIALQRYVQSSLLVCQNWDDII